MTNTEWSKGTVDVLVLGPKPAEGERSVEKQTIAARVNPGGLAVHKSTHGDLDTWAITHIKSGRIARGGYKRLWMALEAADSLLSMSDIDWTLNRSRLLQRLKASDRKLRVKAVLDTFPARCRRSR